MVFTHLDFHFQKGIRYNYRQENFREGLANGITPFALRIKKALGIVPVTEDLQIKWNVILKATGTRLIELLLAENPKTL